jgi:hypothetical protein
VLLDASVDAASAARSGNVASPTSMASRPVSAGATSRAKGSGRDIVAAAARRPPSAGVVGGRAMQRQLSSMVLSRRERQGLSLTGPGRQPWVASGAAVKPHPMEDTFKRASQGFGPFPSKAAVMHATKPAPAEMRPPSKPLTKCVGAACAVLLCRCVCRVALSCVVSSVTHGASRAAGPRTLFSTWTSDSGRVCIPASRL